MDWDRFKVLVAEDNPGDARLTLEMLREVNSKITVVFAGTLSKAVDLSVSEAVDVAILDLGLPDSQGLETLRKLKAKRPDLPIIVMTGLADESMGIEAVRLGAQDYLVKGQADAAVLRRSLLYSIERKMSDNALAEKERFFEAITDLNPAVITVTDLKTGRDIYAGGRGLLGFNSSTARGMAGLAPGLFYPGDFEKVTASGRGLCDRSRTQRAEVEVRVRGADGEWRWLHVIQVVFKRDIDGTPLQRMTIARDIDEQKKVEGRLKQRTEDLEAINQGLEAFNQVVAHDLRAPLRHIGGYARILADEAGPAMDETTRKYVEKIRSAADRMGHLLEDLLSLARLGREELSTPICSLNALVEDVLSDLTPDIAQRDIEWRIEELPSWRCDPVMMKQVFCNLLSNALKFSAGRHPSIIEIGRTTIDKEQLVFVRDNGVGFDMKHAGKLFTLFGRLHNREEFEGTGVGLAIVQRVVRRHGGKIWAESAVNKGATFYLNLPAVNSEVEEQVLAAEA